MPEYWPHQEHTIRLGSESQMALDVSDPGTGKTRAHLAIYARRQRRKRCLVVCPKTLMVAAWASELRAAFPTISFSVATAEKRLKAFEAKTDVVIVNTDGVVSMLKNPKIMAILKEQFDHLIIDEASAFKHRTSQRSKAMAKIVRPFQWRFLLSATPNPNSVTELWHPAFLIDGGERLGNNYFKFRNAVQVPTQIGPQANHLRWDDREGVEMDVFTLLGDITIRHAFEEVMTHVPPNHKAYYDIELPKGLMAQYLALEKTSILELEKTVSAVRASSLRNKLLQLCSGAIYHDDEYTVLDRSRYALIGDLIAERQHSVVFFNWKHQRDELVAELDRRGMYFAVIDGDTPQTQRDSIVAAYQKGYYQTLLLHPRTGAHGLTLTRGTTTILASPIYEADLLKQAIYRIYRGDQDQITNTILVRARNTVEEFVYKRLDDKTVRMDDFLQLVTLAKEQRNV